MSRPVVPTCDECGRVKQESNHWWLAYTEDGVTLCIEPYDPSSEANGMLDLCSEQCVNITVAKWMRGELKPNA